MEETNNDKIALSLDSTKNQGSTFTVSIPMKQMAGDTLNAHSEGDTSASSEMNADGDYRILLVEDMEINRKMAMKILTKAGFKVDAVKDGADAVKRFENIEDGFYDLVLMDIQMPVMDGYEATRQIRSMGREESKKIPIMALSANASEEDWKKSLECGMNGHIAKPFDIPTLIRTVNREIKKYRI